MSDFENKHLPEEPDVVAPDGFDVRVLLRVDGASVAHFELAPNEIAKAVMHKNVDEIWYFLRGRGEMWYKTKEGKEDVVPVYANECVKIKAGTHFQFRSFGDEPLSAIGVTSPPWPLDPNVEEAVVVEGKWPPTV